MIDSYSSHLSLAQQRPVKALRYIKSIGETLAHDIAPGERARLEDALRGLRDGLHASGHCARCGRTLEADESVASGLGSHCRRKAS